MGFFQKLRKLFTNNIEVGNEIEGHYIYLLPSSSRVVKIGCNIIVKDGYKAVFVCNDKVCDVLNSGKYKISGATLPLSFSRLKLDKANKKGKLAKKFKADIYFVYDDVIEKQNFCSNTKFMLKSDRFGKVKGYSEGVCDITILDPDKLLKSLLVDRYYVKNKLGMKIVLGLVGDTANQLIEQSRFSFTQIILMPELLSKYLNETIVTKLNSIGVQIENAEITSFKLNKKLQKQVEEYLLEQQQFSEEFDKTGIKFDPNQSIPQKVEMTNSPNLPQQNVENSAQPSVPPQIIRRGGNINTNNVPNQNSNYQNSINSESVFQEGDKKVCKFCGATIDASFQFCPKCGFKQ